MQMGVKEEKPKRGLIKKLMDKWDLDNGFQVIIILLVFSLAGSTIAFTKKYYFEFLGMDEHTSIAIKIITAFFVYQVILLTYGTILGQFKFFWGKEKRMFLGLFKALKWIVSLPKKLINAIN